MDLAHAVLEASARLRPHVRKTPLEEAPAFSTNKTNVFLKLECIQYTRSFKVRGAINRMLTLTQEEASRGIVTASTGNHGLAVAYGMKKLGVEGTIYLPETASTRKVGLLQRQGASPVFHGRDAVETEAFARQEGHRLDRTYISPYNDPAIIAGQGTIAVELLEDLPAMDAVFVPVGGGGMIAGIAAYVKKVKPDVRVFGCVPRNSPVMYECIQAGKIVEGTVRPTLSDATAGGVEEGAVTFDLCRRLVDEWVLVSEDEIRAAMKLIFEEQALVVEGAAGVGAAACLSMLGQPDPAVNNVAVILCGGNIDMNVFREIIR